MTTELDLVQSGPAPVVIPGTPNAAIETLRAHAEVMQMAYNLAENMVKTDMVPSHFRRKPEDATAAILYGLELGMQPIQSLQQVFPVHGKPSIEARTMVALLMAKGFRFKKVENTNTVATIRGWRPGAHEDDSETVTWTIEDATLAEFVPVIDPNTGKYKLNSNGKLQGNMKYLTQPRQMLWAKACAELCRQLAPDVLLGISYSREDLESEPEPVRVTSERVTETRPSNALYAETVTSREGWAQDGPPVQQWQAPAEEAAVDADPDAGSSTPVVNDTPAENLELNSDEPKADPGPPMTKTQSVKIGGLLRDRGVTGNAEILAHLAAFVGRDLAVPADVTRAEAIEYLAHLEDNGERWAQAKALLERLEVLEDDAQIQWLRDHLELPDLPDSTVATVAQLDGAIAALTLMADRADGPPADETGAGQ